jgi:hypothetical protein
LSDTPLNGWEPKHLSHSAIDKYVRCPYSYWLSYVKRSPFVATRPMLIGTLFGKMIEDLHNGGIAPTMDDLGVQTIAQTHYMNLRDDERPQLDEADLKIVYRLFDMYRSRDGGPYVGTPEYEFKVYLPDRAAVPYPIRGFMDLRVDDAPRIIEFKTGRWSTHHEWGYTQSRVDSMAQATIYWYADKLLNGRDSLVTVVALSYNDRGISMIEKSTQPDMRRLEEFQDEAAKLCAAIKAEDFPCSCGKCKTDAAA